MKMILIINICKERLHYSEFVGPVEDILKKNNIKFQTLGYKELNKEKLKPFSKIIICGTSLQDNEFINHLDCFSCFKTTKKPVLGICAGMQIIGLEFKGKLKNKTEIGFYHEKFKGEFLGLRGDNEVYHLHNNYIEFSGDFRIISGNNIPQAVKHKTKKIYGVLFHPEVRNKELILNFVNKA